ncbi:copper transporter 5 [Beta vulgaris subsp. vulgaris]|uniref:copper transporter 5 n=1 Tax=Beta vulgaris subsp. vulgaris TaxID=3555 RepID=UPI00203709CD|nr:copper transporter 5 [Beta vulgaris subsp. vulgaris]
MMHMTFYWGTKVILLFDFWKTESWLSYSLALLFCILFSAFYQYMEDRRLSILAMGIVPPSQPSINSPLLPPRLGTRLTKSARFATAVLFGVNSAIGYVLMLAVMSYNGGVLCAVVLGLGVGYFLFRAKEYEALVVEDACACS